MTQPRLQLGDVIDFAGEEMTVTKIEGDYAVWYGGPGFFQDKCIARCHIVEHGPNIRLLRRNGKPLPKATSTGKESTQ